MTFVKTNHIKRHLKLREERDSETWEITTSEATLEEDKLYGLFYLIKCQNMGNAALGWSRQVQVDLFFYYYLRKSSAKITKEKNY